MNRSAQLAPTQHRERIGRQIQRADAMDFFNALTGDELLETTEAYLPAHRERLYPPTVTLSMFMRQVLSADRSCQHAVNGWAARRAAEGLKPSSVSTAAYCEARQRLPVEMVMALAKHTGRLLSERAPLCWRWQGRCVKLVDGTTVSMPDTAANQARYPQPSQAAQVGFPMARIVAVICLSTGAVGDVAMGAYEGKGNGELGLFRTLGSAFNRGDIALADALYCNYFSISALVQAGVEVLFEQHGARTTDFRRGQRLGSEDHVVRLPKPANRPEWMSAQHYAGLPNELTVREVRRGNQVLVSTLREPSKGELFELYARRWSVELDLRNIKTTLGMDLLSCKTAQMNEKQIWVYLLAYNLIRLLMSQAACNAGVLPRQLSFKHTVQIWTQWHAHALRAGRLQHRRRLFELIAARRVGNRPGRIEPRAMKRRPKDYPRLTTTRSDARKHLRIHGHP